MNTKRIITAEYTAESDSRRTGLNNNDLIIMPTGGGKTRGYVLPYLLNVDNESFIVTDTKARLYQETGGILKKRGYQVMNIDFTDLSRCTCGFNPLDAVESTEDSQNEADLMRICKVLTPNESRTDPFWDNAATMALTALAAYTLAFLPASQHNLRYVQKLALGLGTGITQRILQQAEQEDPDCFAMRQYHSLMTCAPAEKMFSSILGILAEDLNSLCYDDLLSLYECKERIHFQDLAERKTAVFLTVSDSDESQDHLTACFYQEALQQLIRHADHQPDGRLPVPVRLIMDDFASYATESTLPGFDKTISVIRSREIYVSVICQSLSQLEGAYGSARARTIINNCDQVLIMPGSDLETCQYISKRINKTLNTVLESPVGKAYLFVRGRKPSFDSVYKIRSHPLYQDLPEAENRKLPQCQQQITA